MRLALTFVIMIAVQSLSGITAAEILPKSRFGALQSDPARAEETAAAGLTVATVGVSWDRYEPRPGEFNAAYAEEVRRDIRAFADAGMAVVLDLGWQYPPAWIWDTPHSRFVNQHGEAYDEPREPGSNGVNAVFNQALRDRQAAYLARVVADLRPVLPHIEALRLGGGFYGELQYPRQDFGGGNSYWGFDAIALGQADGLPPTLSPNPVPAWRPGQPSPNGEAGRFLTWYLDALRDYQDWQTRTARAHFDGTLVLLYPGAGIRPGQIEEAISHNLDGSTGAQRTGELQGGRDYARWLNGVDDPNIAILTTWLDATWPGQDDASPNPLAWSPVRYLAHLLRERPNPPPLWGENTDHSTPEDLRRSMERVRAFDVAVLLWAFEPRLYNPDGRYASLEDYAAAIHAATNPSPASPR